RSAAARRCKPSDVLQARRSFTCAAKRADMCRRRALRKTPSSRAPVNRSEIQTKRELDLTAGAEPDRPSHGARDRAERAGSGCRIRLSLPASPCWLRSGYSPARRAAASPRIGEVRPVEQVERLDAKLRVALPANREMRRCHEI